MFYLYLHYMNFYFRKLQLLLLNQKIKILFIKIYIHRTVKRKLLLKHIYQIQVDSLTNFNIKMIQNYSSIKSQQTNRQQHNNQIKHHLQLVFIYYSSFADRNNYHLLKQQNYRRFLIDSQMAKNANDFPQFDILFKKISKGNSNAIGFDEFLKLLPQLASCIYQNESRQMAFKKLIKKDIKKLQVQIRSDSEFGQDLQIIEAYLNRPKITKLETNIINKLQQSSIIKKCYSVYIASTSMHQKSPSDTFQSFYKFLKDFQISPQLIYKSICYVTFIVLLMKKPQETKNQFEIESFVKMILLLSQIITKKQFAFDQSSLCATGKICKILQKMQVSAGFDKISKLVKGQTYYTMSLVRMIIGQDGILPDKDHCLQQLDESLQKGSAGLVRHKGCSLPSHYEKVLNSSYNSLNTLANEPQEFKQIKRIFQDLCSYGEVGNNKTLKSMKIKKLYLQTGLLKVIAQVWLDITITQLIRKSTSGKIEFLQFVQLLDQTAKKLSVNSTEIYNLIINHSKDSSSNDYYKNTLNNSVINNYSEEEITLCLEMLQTIAYPLERVFHFYSKSKNQISFSEMTKLMYDFQIFPSILSKTKLYQIFSQCYQQSLDKIAQNSTIRNPDLFLKEKYNSASKNQNSASKYTSVKLSSNMKTGDPHLKQQKLMHISTFPQFMLKASNQICEQGLTATQKLIILIQKMHQSKGQQKVVLGKGSLVSQLRKNYPHIYKMSFGLKQSKQQLKQDVEDLLDTISEY